MVKNRPLYKKNNLMLAEMMRHGYTIRSLSEAVGVHYLTIWRIVNRAHQPKVETADAICKCLDVKPHQLGLKPWGDKGRKQAEADAAAAEEPDQGSDAQ